MKILILSDIHGNDVGLKTVLQNAGSVDKILCAGDFSGYYPFVNEVITIAKKNNFISVLGNHDAYQLGEKVPSDKKNAVTLSVDFVKNIISKESLDYLASLPQKLALTIANKKVLMVHGSPWDVLDGRIYPDYSSFDNFESLPYDIIIMGQSHYPFIKKVGEKVILNPGSCGQPRDYNKVSYILWDTEKDSFVNKRVDWDIAGFMQKCKENNTPEEFFSVFERVSQD